MGSRDTLRVEDFERDVTRITESNHDFHNKWKMFMQHQAAKLKRYEEIIQTLQMKIQNNEHSQV